MKLSAFHGDPAVRHDALDRLGSHMERKARIAGAFQWDGDKGTIAACLIDSDDKREWETRLGLAPWLAFALDAVTTNFATPRAVDAASALLKKIPLGADTQAGASRSILLLLEDLTTAEPLERPLANVLASAREIHTRLIGGDDAEPSQWRRLRRLAVDASEVVPAQDGAGRVIEAAAWSPLGSPTAVGEVLRHAIHAAAARMHQGSDWTAADEDRVKQLLTEMHETYILPDPNERRDVFELLAVHHPTVEARLRAHVQQGNQFSIDAAEHMLALLLKAIGNDALDAAA